MKKFNFIVAVILSLSMLTACFGNTNNAEVTTTSQMETEITTAEETATAEEVTTVEATTAEETTTAEGTTTTEEVTTAEETTSETETSGTKNAEGLAEKYADILCNTEIKPTSKDAASFFDLADCGIMVIDVNFDGVPEICHVTYSNIGAVGVTVYTLDSSVYYASNSEKPYNINNNLYYIASTMGKNTYTQVLGDKKVEVEYALDSEQKIDDTKYSSVKCFVNDVCENEYTDIMVDDLHNILESFLGVDLLNVTDNDLEKNVYIEYLRVDDPMNYTKEDIAECLNTYLEEYYKLVNE